MILPLLAAIALLGGGRDSLPRFKACQAPTTPIGHIHGSGTIAITVSESGAPDPASLTLLEVQGVSAPAYRSVLLRHLDRCGFKPARADGRPTAARVRSMVRIARDTILWGPLAMAEATDTIDAPGLPQPPALPEGEVLTPGDHRLEELPRGQLCTRMLIARDEVVTRVRVNGQVTANIPVSEIPRYLESTHPQGPPLSPPSGEVLASFVVSDSGTVRPETFRVIQATSPDAAELIRRRLMACRWAPGRIGGVPVPVQITAQEHL